MERVSTDSPLIQYDRDNLLFTPSPARQMHKAERSSNAHSRALVKCTKQSEWNADMLQDFPMLFPYFHHGISADISVLCTMEVVKNMEITWAISGPVNVGGTGQH